MWWSNISTDLKTKVLIYVFFVGAVFGNVSYLIFKYDPVNMLTEKIIEFEPNSFLLKIWTYPPYDVVAKLYLFNVTNPDEFLSGQEKLRFEEVGPYTYREILFNTNVKFEDNGTVTYVPRREIVFEPKLSIGNPFNDTLILPNFPFLGILASAQDYSMIVKLTIAQTAFILDSQPFVNLTVNEYLFGYDDALVTLANNILPNWIDFSRFGMVERIMALDNVSTTINMPVNTAAVKMSNRTLYSIEKFNGSSGFLHWGYSEAHSTKCNRVKGCFIGTLFPPKLTKNSSLVLYRHGFCRPLPMRFNHSDTSKYLFKSYVFEIVDDFLYSPEENPNNHCYCRRKRCLPRGVGDISPCYYNIPVAISQPHFLNADPITRIKINGMRPDANKHNFYMAIHPDSGLPLEAKLRLQINLHVPDTKFNYKTKPFNNLILPLFWVELSVDGPPIFINILLFIVYVILPNFQVFLKYVLAILSAIFTMGSVFYFLCRNYYKYQQYLQVDPYRHNEIETFALRL